jgi:chitodextrinase
MPSFYASQYLRVGGEWVSPGTEVSIAGMGSAQLQSLLRQGKLFVDAPRAPHSGTSGLTPRGAWDAGTAYVAGDLVTDEGSSWIAQGDTTGDKPNVSPAAWQEFAVASSAPAVALSPDDFGAIGDGVADDAAAWQAALNVAGATIVQGTPGKTYRLRNLQVFSDTTVDLRGVAIIYGGAQPFPEGAQTQPGIFHLIGTEASRVVNVTVEGGLLTGNRPANAWTVQVGADADDLFQCIWGRNVTVKHVTLRDAGQDAIEFKDTIGATVDGCRFIDCADAAVEFRRGGNNRVVGCTFDRVNHFVDTKPDTNDVLVAGNQGTTYGYGMGVHGQRWTISGNQLGGTSAPDGQTAANASAIVVARHPVSVSIANLITDINVESNTVRGYSDAVAVSDLNGQTVERVRVANNIIHDCLIAVFCRTDAQVVGNRIGACRSGIRLVSKTGLATAQGNVITTYGVHTSGYGVLIHSDSTKPANVSGNTIRVTDAQPVWVAGGTGHIISGNYLSVEADTRNEAGILIGAAGVSFTGNRVETATSAQAAVLISAADASVTDNVTVGFNHGIRPQNARAQVVGNRCSAAGFNGIFVTSAATDTLVVGNYLSQNPTPLSDAGTGTLAANNLV